MLLGYYDFDKFSVLLGAHDDPRAIPITLLHEAYHQRLNNSTAFGHALNKVASSVARSGSSSERQKYLRELLDHCVVVHEMLATYCSLVSYGREDLVTQLPPAYQTCFALMEMALTYVPASRLWRTTSAWHLARIAMLTKPYEHLADLNTPDPRNIADCVKAAELKSPNHRMRIISDVMQSFDFDLFLHSLEKWSTFRAVVGGLFIS